MHLSSNDSSELKTVEQQAQSKCVHTRSKQSKCAKHSNSVCTEGSAERRRSMAYFHLIGMSFALLERVCL